MSDTSKPLSIDILAPQKSHLDLSDRQLPTDFGLDDYKLSFLFDDVMLLEYADLVEGEEGDSLIKRNGILIPTAQITSAWRKGVVVIAGPRVLWAKVGDIVMFPSNLGIPISNVEVDGFGKVKKGLFLNEARMFGICKVKDA